MTKRRPHRHQRDSSTRRNAGQNDDAPWTTPAGRPAGTSDELPDPVAVSSGMGTTGGLRQNIGTLAGNDAETLGDAGIGGDDMFGANTAGAGSSGTGKINRHGAGTDQAGFGSSDGGASDPPGGATTGVGGTFGTTPGGTDVSRGDNIEGDPPQS